jgi:hypothetical protein
VQGEAEMQKAIITTIDQEFKKAVKPFSRTRKGKLEHVKGFERKHSTNFHHWLPSEGGPEISKKDISFVNRHMERHGIRAKASLQHSPYEGHHAVVLGAATKGDLSRGKKTLKEWGIDIY